MFLNCLQPGGPLLDKAKERRSNLTSQPLTQILIFFWQTHHSCHVKISSLYRYLYMISLLCCYWQPLDLDRGEILVGFWTKANQPTKRNPCGFTVWSLHWRPKYCFHMMWQLERKACNDPSLQYLLEAIQFFQAHRWMLVFPVYQYNFLSRFNGTASVC